jgi:hypothetical protein
MNRTEIDSDHWVERYLAGRLSETESRRFEAYWIENPDLIRDLERGARLKSGLAEMRECGELPALMRASWWPGRFRLLVLAASVAVVAIGAALWNGSRGVAGVMLAATPAALPGLDGGLLPRGSAQSILRLRRAASVDAVVALPTTPQALELRVLPELDADAAPALDGARDTRAYTATLATEGDAGGAPGLHRVDNLFAAADGFVSLFVDSRTLAPGRYRLRLEPAGSAAEAAGTGFLIDVRADAPPP